MLSDVWRHDLEIVLTELGISTTGLVQLRSTNNVVVLVEPLGIVAKMHRDPAAASRELRVALALHRADAPVGPPAIGVPPVVHDTDGWHVTFWSYLARVGSEPDAEAIAVSLRELHHRFREQQQECEPLPPCTASLEDAESVIRAGALDDRVEPEDRALLLDVLGASVEGIDHHLDAALHGSPHVANVIPAAGGLRFIDFETACRGPVEWDVAHLDRRAARAFGTGLDLGLLDTCRDAVSAATATWCFAGIDRGPDMRDHAVHHLEIVRSRAAG